MSLLFRSQSLQDTEDARTSRWYFDLIEGIPGHESPQVRGEDVIAPGHEGRYTGNRVNDIQELILEGFIRGFGATPGERSTDWHTNTQTIMGVFDLDDATGELIVGPGTNDYLGLDGNYSMQCRTLDHLPGPILGHMSYQRWSIRLFCIDEDFWTAGS